MKSRRESLSRLKWMTNDSKNGSQSNSQSFTLNSPMISTLSHRSVSNSYNNHDDNNDNDNDGDGDEKDPVAWVISSKDKNQNYDKHKYNHKGDVSTPNSLNKDDVDANEVVVTADDIKRLASEYTESEITRSLATTNTNSNRSLSTTTADELTSVSSTGFSVVDDNKNNEELRLIANNVKKLSPPSVVEIRLQASSSVSKNASVPIKRKVSILCSVDVLKMYSEFFLQVLIDMDESPDSQINSNGFREPIILPEQDPDEAASFLNMLHTSSLNQDSREWNIAHARLSVHWQIESLIAEYAYQIECHVNRILNTIDMNHWRTNPNVFKGYHIAVFRKGSTVPTVLMGTIIESNAHEIPSPSTYKCHSSLSTPNSMLASPLNTNSTIRVQLETSDSPTPMKGNNRNICDVRLPFWIKNKTVGSVWEEPDDYFMQNNFKNEYVTSVDRKIFWECAQCVIELPHLKQALGPKSRMRSIDDLINILSRPEYKILWMDNHVDVLPKACACALLSKVYIDE